MTATKSNGKNKIDDTKIVEYLEKVMNGDVEFDSKLESKIAENFVIGQKNSKKLAAQIEKQKADLKKGENLLIELGGRIDENVKLLVMAFVERESE